MKTWVMQKTELRKTVQQLEREFPYAGLALWAFANPIAAVIGAVMRCFAQNPR